MLQGRTVIEPARDGAGEPARVHATRGTRAAQEARAAAQTATEEPQSKTRYLIQLTIYYLLHYI